MELLNKKILVCEDNPHIQLLLKIFFEKRGWTPVVVPDGMEALAAAREHEPVLVVMDIIMPGKDGIAACRELREAGVTVPIVMLTSKDLPDDRKRAEKAGATAFLSKPFNPQQLQAVIAPLLNHA